jgi:hypothetical protein
VVARCANLPVDIRNGERFGGGCVVGWLPIVSFKYLTEESDLRPLQVPEPAKEERKTGYTNFKRVIWHEAFLRLLEQLVTLSKTGYSHECYDKIIRWLFPIILILSADYEEL